MLQILKNMINVYPILWILLFMTSNVKSDSINSEIKEENNNYNDEKIRSMASDYWKNHRYYINYLYAKDRESKSNNEQYFADSGTNDQYEAMPSTLQLSAMPASGYEGYGGHETYSNDRYGGHDDSYGFKEHGWKGHGWKEHQKFPVFVINKSKSDHIKWLIPLLLLLGAPLLCGLILIPIALQTIFFIFTIIRNLGFILPLLPGLAGVPGLPGLPGNPIIPTG